MPAVTVEECRRVHSEDQDRLDRRLSDVWDKVNEHGQKIEDLRVAQTGLSVRVAVITGCLAMLPGMLAFAWNVWTWMQTSKVLHTVGAGQ